MGGTILIAMAGKDLNDITPRAIGQRLQWTRLALEFRQQTKLLEWAKRLPRAPDLSPQKWSQYEAGKKRIPPENALFLSIYKGISLDWIYRGDLTALPHKIAAQIQELMAVDADAAPKPRAKRPARRRAPQAAE